MKKLFYLFALVVLCAVKGSAQDTITSYSTNNHADSFCSPTHFTVITSGGTAGLQVMTYYGDGTADANPVIGGVAVCPHDYSAAGMYTIKHVLFLGTNRMDSVVYSHDFTYCSTMYMQSFFDANSNCVFDSGEIYASASATIIVDSNGITVDTLHYIGAMYKALGNPGDIYAFRVISTSPGVAVTCPAGGVIYDTLSTIVNNYSVKYFGFTCSASGYDASVLASTRARVGEFYANILVSNAYCTPAPVTLTFNLSPKYFVYTSWIYPPPSSVSGNTLVWNLPALSSIGNHYNFRIYGMPVGSLTLDDTVHSSYSVTPLTGDADTSNNKILIIDTIKASHDPNDKTVSPEGYLLPGPGDKLTYTIRFENTGNDTAFNIHVQDTLSNYLDVNTLNIVGSSSRMNLGIQNDGSNNIVKFDFPNINLLDSSHHGECDGLVRFTIKTKDGLAYGTQIDNRAGIYFDYNPVVMTNTVTNIVGYPDNIEDMGNTVSGAVELFPNPTANELTVKINKGTYSTISVVNNVGQEVMTQNVSGNNTKLNVKALPSGSYYITVKGNGGVKVQRFQKI